MAIFLLLISPAIGSFLGLLADRLARGEDVVVKGSACRSCGARLGVGDLVPLLSYLWLRGRCRHCQAPIPPWLVLIEVGAVLIAICAVIIAKSEAQMWLGALWLWALLGLCVTDARWFRLPDLLTAALLIFGLALAFEDPSRTVLSAVIAALAGAGVFLAIRLAYQFFRGREGMGLGDVKLMAGLGAGLGIQALPLMVLIAAMAGLLWAIISSLKSGTAIAGQTALPFGSFLSVAGGLVWLYIQAI